MSKDFNTLRGITIASALHGEEKKELLSFINHLERVVAGNEPNKGLDRQ